MSSQLIPEGTRCRYKREAELCVTLFGSTLVYVLKAHPVIMSMVEVVGVSGHKEYVMWCDLEVLEDQKLIYEETKISAAVKLQVASDRSHALVERTGSIVRLSRQEALSLAQQLNQTFVLDSLGDI